MYTPSSSFTLSVVTLCKAKVLALAFNTILRALYEDENYSFWQMGSKIIIHLIIYLREKLTIRKNMRAQQLRALVTLAEVFVSSPHLHTVPHNHQ